MKYYVTGRKEEKINAPFLLLTLFLGITTKGKSTCVCVCHPRKATARNRRLVPIRKAGAKNTLSIHSRGAGGGAAPLYASPFPHPITSYITHNGKTFYIPYKTIHSRNSGMGSSDILRSPGTFFRWEKIFSNDVRKRTSD